MSKFVALSIHLFLIAIIFFRLPEEYLGLTSFATQSTALGSPTSAQRFWNNATVAVIGLYFLSAWQRNVLLQSLENF